LCVVGTATTEAGATAISEALAAFPGSRGIVLDVTDGDAVGAAIDACVVKEHGALHVLVNNAGITRDMLDAHEGRGLARGARHQPHRRVSRQPRRDPADDEAALRADRQHHLGGRRQRQSRPGQLRRAKAGVAGTTRSLAREVAAAASPSTASPPASSRPT
jgi:3-oxoacyl-[acyl-carrier protein] reductase